MKRARTAVLVSGNGSNLQALLDAARDPGFPAEVVLVISNVAGVRALEARARSSGGGWRGRSLTWSIALTLFGRRGDGGLGAIGEVGLLCHHAQQPRRRSTRLVHTGLPLAHGLLSDPKLLRKLALRGAEVDAERPDGVAVPCRRGLARPPAWLLSVRHGILRHGLTGPFFSAIVHGTV